MPEIPPFKTADKVLSEDIFAKTRDFFPTWFEWQAINNSARQIVVEEQKVGTGQVVVYSIPENQTFYLTNLFLNYELKSTAGSETLLVAYEGGNKNLLELHLVGASTSDNVVMNFPFPIIIGGQDIRMTNTGGIKISSITIIGFLLDKNI